MIQAFHMDRCHYCPFPESARVICRSIQRKVKDFFAFFTCSMSVKDVGIGQYQFVVAVQIEQRSSPLEISLSLDFVQLTSVQTGQAYRVLLPQTQSLFGLTELVTDQFIGRIHCHDRAMVQKHWQLSCKAFTITSHCSVEDNVNITAKCSISLDLMG